MSMDIRSFFTTVSKKTGTTKLAEGKNKEGVKKASKKRQISANSSIDDIIPETPDIKTSKKTHINKKDIKRRRIAVLSDSGSDDVDDIKFKSKGNAVISDSESDSEKGKQNITKKSEIMRKEKKREEIKLKKGVNPFDAFGDEPVKQVKVEKSKPKPELNIEINIHDDADFEKTLIELDEEQMIQDTLSKSGEKNKMHENQDDGKTENVKRKTPQKTQWNVSATSTPSSSRKRKLSEQDDSINTDLERFEKKKHSAMLYQKYLNRSGPAHVGSKWIPRGGEDCLKDLTFVITGVLDSLSREDAENLIAEHGGKCMKSLSGKTKFMVVGEEAGPAKLEKASKLGTKLLDEDQLIDLICSKSGIKNKNKTRPDHETAAKSESEVLNKATPSNKHSQKPIKNIEIQLKSSKPSEKVENEDEIPSVTIKISSKTSPPRASSKFNEEPCTSNVKTEEKIVSESQLSWVDKYRPTDMKQIIGQQGDGSNAHKLMNWLKNWYNNQNGKTKLVKPSPWAKNDNGAYFKAALLSGPPGIGKTTTANVVSRALSFDVVEFNASNTRSKRMLQEQVAQLLRSRSLAGFARDGSAPSRHHVLLMDEVDGMSGNEDRGGVQELIALIRASNVPVLCLCNDRQHPKVRSLANYCYDLRFGRPRLEQVRGAMRSICFKEGLDIGTDQLTDLIVGSGLDLRQVLNNLSLCSASVYNGKNESERGRPALASKDVKLGPWDVIRKVFSEEEQKHMTIEDKYGLFFYDYSINPLFVQENYLQVKPNCPAKEVMNRVAYAADSISLGDVVEAKIRSTQSWGLLDTQALYASVLPGACLAGHMAGQINFPGWLGKNSRAGKFQRLLGELGAHMRTSVSGGRTALALDYLPHVLDAVVRPMVRGGQDGVPEALAVMRHYNLMREDLTSLAELARWPRGPDPLARIEPKVKAAFTRAYNRDVTLPYAVTVNPVRRRPHNPVSDDQPAYGEDDDQDGEDSAPEDDDIEHNPMIKVKKPGAKTSVASAKGAPKEKLPKGKAASNSNSKPRAKRPRAK